MRVGIILLLAACAGTRGSLDTAGPELAIQNHAKTALYFGEGCYAVGDEYAIHACSVDVLPVGERICSHEPGEEFGIGFYNDRFPTFENEHGRRWVASWDHERVNRQLASFVTELNEHRCHRRWREQVECEPVKVEARAAEKPARGSVPWPADLGTLRATVDLSTMGAADIFGHGPEWIEVDVQLCVGRNGKIEPSIWYFVGHGTTPFYTDVLRGITDGVSTKGAKRGECTTAHLAISNIRCSNPEALEVEVD